MGLNGATLTLLNVVVGQSATIFELLAGEDEALLIRRDALLVLDLRLHVVDRVRGLDLQRDRLTGESLYENLIAERRGGVDGVSEIGVENKWKLRRQREDCGGAPGERYAPAWLL